MRLQMRLPQAAKAQPAAAGGALALFAVALVATGSVGREDWTLVRRLVGARDPG